MALIQPTLIPQPWGSDGQVGNIPQDSSEFGKASWAKGFPTETAQPLTEGGIPPSYLDFQGVLNVLSSHAVFMQSGAHYAWSNTLDYPAGCFVRGSDGKLYQALQASGPGYSAGIKNPTTSATYWSVVPVASEITELENAVSTAQSTADGKAPKAHASTAATYGIGTGSNYGHVKLSDSTSSTSEASKGIAASPKAVKDAYDKAVAAYLPVGSVIAYASNSSVHPAGYLLCNGAAVSRTTYAALFDVIGTTYGTGNGSSTFNLPNLADRFIQGSGTAGTAKAAGLPNITGGYTDARACPYADVTGAFTGTYTMTFGGSYSSNGTGGHIVFDASNSNAIYGSAETVQPPAVTMRYYIKY